MRKIVPALALVVLLGSSCTQDDPWSRTRSEIRQIFQLPLVEMEFREVIYHSKDRDWWNLLDSSKEALFAIPVKILGGFDLSKGFEIFPSQDRRSVEVVFPLPEVLLADARDEKILQYFSLPVSGSLSQEELHSLLRQGTESARGQALELGILDKSKERAKDFLTSFFGLMGYETVVLRFGTPAPAVQEAKS